MKRIATALSYSLFAAVLIAAVPAEAQTKDADTITRSLMPKGPKKPLTRSFGKPELSEDAKFLKNLKTRGLRIDEREKLDEIVKKQDLPKIDIEIAFDLDSDVIKASSIPDVDELGKALTAEGLAEARIALNGHTDASGSDTYNQDLSDRRAASVRQYLIEKFKIDGNRLIAIGFGESKLKNAGDPLAPENRRVEVVNLAAS